MLHAHREHNCEADAASNIFEWHVQEDVSVDAICLDCQLLRIHFDGSFKEDGRSSAGLVLFVHRDPCSEPLKAATISIPLCVESACQAELCACAGAVAFMNALAKRRYFESICNSLKKLEGVSIEKLAKIGNWT